MEKKLTEFEFDMMPTDLRKLVLEDMILLDDNLDSDEDFIYDVDARVHVLPVKLMFPLVIICKAGEMRARLNLEEYVIKENDALVIIPGTIGEDVGFSKDCRVAIMAFPENAFPLLMKMEHSLRFREFMTRPFLFHFTDDQMNDALQIYRLMRSVIQSDTPYKKEIIINYMEALSYYSIGQVEKTVTDANIHRGSMIFHQFMDEVRKNYTHERQLSFYADKLCITSKYLSRVVKQQSGRQPSDWIRDYVILEAKALLKHNAYTVQQVSDLLHFPNPSFFGKYFKMVVGCSPRKYQMAEKLTETVTA